ncbi:MULTISPECIES: hypothetical protein [unclassified Mycobacterium]|uniref:hypothetical protein n=1 Tax=unclassified Mycobacterium TaxID=2642494 RepID=UPI0007FC7305|nr:MULTISPECIES: hypothetical protein [unclassified Mycobacterium]OBH07602.1 hypothetical protein A5696_21555 [Mycobacterium sp. E2699]OBI54013.1 hypothetical protein A5705_01370 [Mycobacterium sp. E787]
MSNAESLLDTFPGRLFIERMRSVGGLGAPEELISAASRAVGSYLYSDRCLDVADFDVDDLELRAYDEAGLSALSALPTFGSPQIHQGALGELRAPNVSNREPLSALPKGAFWTSTPITDNDDSWTLCGENLARESPRWEVRFDTARVRVALIDSARDWADLIDSHAATANGCRYPDWRAIAQSWDAVHLSPAGLLLAHPKISVTPFSTADGSGHAHSPAGPYVSVADWSAVSTAWLREPPSFEFAPAPGPA